MYIAVDKQKMRIIYKHTKMKVLTDLTWLEYPEVAVGIHSAAVENDFSRYTDMEVRMLYQNTTQEATKGLTRSQMVTTLLRIVESLPDVLVNERELHHQCRAVGEREKTRYLYSPGMAHPQIMSKLFERPFITVTRGENEQFLCATQRLYLHTAPVQHTAPQPVPAAAPSTENRTASVAAARPAVCAAPASSNDVKRPKPGTICASLWDLFDELAAAGNELNAKDLLGHKDVEGINPSTLRTQLGHWKKYNAKN